MFVIGKNKDGKLMSLVTKVGVKKTGEPVKEKEIGKNWGILIKKGWIVDKKNIIDVEHEIVEKKSEDVIPEIIEKEKPKKAGRPKKEKEIIIGAVKKESENEKEEEKEDVKENESESTSGE